MEVAKIIRIPKGTIVKINGMPFELKNDTEFFGNEANYDSRQSYPSCVKPNHAALPIKSHAKMDIFIVLTMFIIGFMLGASSGFNYAKCTLF